MIKTEEDVFKLAKKFKLVNNKGYIDKTLCPNPDVFPELLGPNEDKRTFINKWFKLARSYNRKQRNLNNLKNVPNNFYREELDKLEGEKKKQKHPYSRPKKGNNPNKINYIPWRY